MKENQLTYNSFRIAVPKAFEDVFSHFYFAENKSGETITKTLLPSFQVIMIFNFGAKVSFVSCQGTELEIDKCLVLGPIKHAFDYALSPNAEILVANFKDDAFYRFFGNASIGEFIPVNPDELLDENCFTALWNDLDKIKGVTLKVNHILDFCKPYLQTPNIIAKQIAEFSLSNLSPIKKIAEANKLSERTIQISHKKHLGYTAKEITRYQRFLKAIELIEHIASCNTKMDWFEIVNECGYYDQSQLIHDFKHYLNLSPGHYLKFQEDICNPRF